MTNYMDSLNEIIQEYRECNDLTITQFAKEVHILRTCLCNWQNQRFSPSLASLIKLADFFDCSLDYMVGRSEFTGYVPAVKHECFCERIELLLKKHNLTFYKFSKSCRIDFNAYCKWKKNSIPTVFNLIAVAEYFNVSLDYLVGRSDSI